MIQPPSLQYLTQVLPLINTIQSNWCETQITWILETEQHALVKNKPAIQFVVFDKNQKYRRTCHLFAKVLKKQRFDLALVLYPDWYTSLLSLLVRAKVKLGLSAPHAWQWQKYLVDWMIPTHPQQHSQEALLSISEMLSMEKRLIWDSCYSMADLQQVQEWLPPATTRKLLISPHAPHPKDRLPPADWADIADHAIETHRFSVVLTGQNRERPYTQAIATAMHHPVIDLAGKTSLRQLMALLSQVQVFVGMDTAPLFMADSLGIPAISLATKQSANNNTHAMGPYLNRQWRIQPDAKTGCANLMQVKAMQVRPMQVKPMQVKLMLRRLLGDQAIN